MIPQYVVFLLYAFSVTGASNYATEKDGAVTLFKNAYSSGTIALIAHNYKAGEYFDDLSAGDSIVLIYPDRSSKTYIASEFIKYLALQPLSLYSDFVPDQGGARITSTQLYRYIYGADDGRIVLQTCYDGTNGRLFILAYPEESLAINLPKESDYELHISKTKAR